MKKDYDSLVQDFDLKLSHLSDKLKKQADCNDEKDLEISRLRRECEELSKKHKSSSEKAAAYQKTNEKVRKDKQVIEEKYKDLQRQLEMERLNMKSSKQIAYEDSSEDSDKEERSKKRKAAGQEKV